MTPVFSRKAMETLGDNPPRTHPGVSGPPRAPPTAAGGDGT